MLLVRVLGVNVPVRLARAYDVRLQDDAREVSQLLEKAGDPGEHG